MIQIPTLNGWLGWSYDNKKYSFRQDKFSTYRYEFNIELTNLQTKSYYDELYNNAKLMRDYYSEPFDVLLSGGIDSEIVVRTFKDCKIKHNTFVFRYEDNINHRDVQSAIKIAAELNLPIKIIDINLEHFFETEAIDYFKKSGAIKVGRLPHLKFFEYLDNIPVMGDGEPYWKKHFNNSSTEWLFLMSESAHNSQIYLTNNNRKAICDWYEFSPSVIKSFNNLPIIKNLIKDQIFGKLSNWSIRTEIHKKLWPSIVDKKKLTGYEKFENPGTYPIFMQKFQQYMTEEVGEGQEYWLTHDLVS